MKIAMHRTYHPVNAADIAAVEGRVGASLPSGYRAFLEAHNGGWPEKSLFVSADEEISVRFFGIGLPPEEDYDDVLATWDRVGDTVPEDFLPIGTDPGGSMILLGTSPRNEGQVFFLDDLADPDEPEKRLRRIAATLEEFLEHLQEEPEDTW